MVIVRSCVLVLAFSFVGCTDASAFACHDASDCASALGEGTCELTGYCSFPANDCPSGRRYGEHAPAELANTCVPVDDGTSAADPTVADDGEGTVGEASSGPSTITTSPLDESSSTTFDGTSLETTSLPDPDTSGGSDDGSSTPDAMLEVVYDAAIAVCTQDTVFDPMVCAEEAGIDQLTVDLADDGDLVSTGWIRFDLDDTLAGATIVSAELVLVVGSETNDASGSTGELWTVESFDLAALMVGYPAALELVGADLGPVRLGDEIVWSLPAELVEADASLHLAIVPVATDGLDVLDGNSDMPPRLRVSAM
jgi:hypothetical protein